MPRTLPARRSSPLLALALALALCPAPARADEPVELVVRRDAGLTAAERLDVRTGAGVQFDHRLRLPDAEVVTVPASEAAAALAALRDDPDVRWAQRNGEVRAASAGTSDPYFAQQYALRNTGQAVNGVAGTTDADMDVVEAWARSTGAGVTVGVVDSGAQLAHPDLAGQLARNAGETGGGKESNGLDDDGDGLVDDWQGWDFVQHDNAPDDGDGHGTHVAGTIAAANGNGAGVSGVAPDARVLVLRALDDTGAGTWTDVADAFDLAGDLGIPIVNASLGASGSSQAITDVILAHPNTLYVVAAGNAAADIESPATTYFPCEVPAANVVCVGASDQADARASFSNVGATAVDLFAPGKSIVATLPTSTYAYMSGTSMAAPDVAGVAALVRAAEPSIGTAALKAALLAGTDAKAGLAGLAAHGRVNAVGALDAAGAAPGPAPVAPVAPVAPAPVPTSALDADDDGVPDGADRCPTVPAATPDGCPLTEVPPTPTPIATAPADAPPPSTVLSGPAPSSPPATPLPAVIGARPRVERCVRVRPCRNRLTLTVTARAATSISVDLAVRRCVHGRCRWAPLAVRTAPVASAAARVGIRQLLGAGRYRVGIVAHGARRDSAPFFRTVTIAR